MELSWKINDGDPIVLVLAGAVDLSGTPELRKVLTEQAAAGDDVVVDLADVTFMDSSGVGALVTSLGKFKQRGARLALSAMQAPVARVFEMTMLDQTFEIHDTVEAAVEAFNA